MVPIYIFISVIQPGILFPDIASFRLQLIVGIIMVIVETIRGNFHIYWDRVHTYVTLFLFAQATSVYYSGFLAMLNELIAWGELIGIFFILTWWINGKEENFRSCLWAYLLGAMFITLYGISRFYWDPLVPGRWIIGGYGMYENQNDYSFPIIISFPFWLWYGFYSKGILRRLVSIGLSAISIAGVIFSLSRAGAISMVVEGIMAIWLFMKKFGSKAFMVPVIGLVSVFVIYTVWDKRDIAQKGNYSYEDSKDSRSDLWVTGKNMFLAHPILGIGSRRFVEYNKEYMPSWADKELIKGKNAHNTYIEILASSGLFGFLPIMGAIWLSTKKVYQKWRLNIEEIKNNMAVPLLVVCIGYYFRLFFNAKIFTMEIFFVIAMSYSLCSTKSLGKEI